MVSRAALLYTGEGLDEDDDDDYEEEVSTTMFTFYLTTYYNFYSFRVWDPHVREIGLGMSKNLNHANEPPW